MENSKVKKIVIFALLFILIILLYLLILKFGLIEHFGPQIPTGNVDVIEIEDKDDDNNKDEDINENKPNNDSELENNESTIDEPNDVTEESTDIEVFDKYKIYDTKELKIFENPAFEFREVIAPGSENSYEFVIKNNNNFDILVDLKMIETNIYGFNMKYKLRDREGFIIGSDKDYVNPSDLHLEKVLIKANGYVSYILDWKWVHSKKDTLVGINDESNYSLKIEILAEAK